MNKKVLVSALVGAVAQMLLGFLIYGYLMKDMMMDNLSQFPGLLKPEDAAQMVHWFLSGLFYTWLFAYLFDKYIHPDGFMGGLKVGMLIALFVSLSFDIGMYGYMNIMSMSGMIYDVIAATVMGGIVGGVVAWTQGKMGGAAA